MSKGSSSQAGFNAQNWAALSLFVQYSAYSSFKQIDLEQPKLHASNVHVRMLLEEHGWSFAPQPRLLLLPTHAPEKPDIVLHTTRLTKGILRIPLLIRKHSGMVTTTAMAHLSSG